MTKNEYTMVETALTRVQKAANQAVFTLGEYNRLIEEGVNINKEQDRRRKKLVREEDRALINKYREEINQDEVLWWLLWEVRDML